MIGSDSKTNKKKSNAPAIVIEEDKKPPKKFFNSKRPGTELSSTTPPLPEIKKDTVNSSIV